MREELLLLAIFSVVFLGINGSAYLLDGYTPHNGWYINPNPTIEDVHHWANYGKSCSEDSFNLKFTIKSLVGGVQANTNIIKGLNRYAIGFFDLKNGSLATHLFKQADNTSFKDYTGLTISYDSNHQYDVEIDYNKGHMQVYVIEEGQEFTAPTRVINYYDPDPSPLPPGGIDFETLEKSHAQLSDIILTCSAQTTSSSKPPNLGEFGFESIDPSYLVDASSEGWGMVAANQLMVGIDPSVPYDEAKDLANNLAITLGGTLVGESQYLNLFQIITTSTSLAELKRDIDTAIAFDPRITEAFPNQPVYPDSPLDNGVYAQDNNRKSYDIIGVPDAWRQIAGPNVRLSEVCVGVTDDGIYLKGCTKFDENLLNTGIHPYPDIPSAPNRLSGPVPLWETAGSHGTGVMSILAADPKGNGIAGIASQALGKNLKTAMINIYRGGGNTPSCADGLAGLCGAILQNYTILSCSWGNSHANPGWVHYYEGFFRKFVDPNTKADERWPYGLFICSAGNDGGSIDGQKRIPNGRCTNEDLPNVITVGNILNNGEIANGQFINNDKATKCNLNGKYFTVDIAAPGEQTVFGACRDRSGRLQVNNYRGGTSMATPQVTAAAAMIRSINPTLDAERIKEILLDQARDKIMVGGRYISIPAGVGGHVLAIDKAVNEALHTPREDSNSDGPTELEIGEKPLDEQGTIQPDVSLEISSDVYADYDPQIYYCQQDNMMLVYNRIYLTGSADALSEVKKVTYYLHESFPQPVRVSTDPKNNFEIWIMAWGGFLVRAEIELNTGDTIERTYDFAFRDKVNEAKEKGIPMVPVPCDTDIHGSMGSYSSYPGTQPAGGSGFDTGFSGQKSLPLNSLWIPESNQQLQHTQCSMADQLKMIAYSSGGPATMNEVYPDGHSVQNQYTFQPGYNEVIFAPDVPGRHTLAYSIYGQLSNTITIDVVDDNSIQFMNTAPPPYSSWPFGPSQP